MREWRELGFFYDRDDGNKVWKLTGSRAGLLRFRDVLLSFGAPPRNARDSEHKHFGPYSFLETITSPGAGFDNHAIRGTVADLGRLSALVEAKLATMSPGDKIRIHEEFAPDSPYALLLDLREDGYDPPTADSLLAGENSSGSLPDYNWDEVSKAIEHGDYDFVLKNAMPHALAGNSDAQCTIAFLYEAGWGVQRDVLEAERWLLKATAQNSPLAWHNLGTLYFVQHRELEHKWCEGRKCWERAKELGFNCGEPYPPWDPESPSPD
ncbi:MAG: hypothetical protein WA757_14725 [Candidatus Acidiferrales bacterium]